MSETASCQQCGIEMPASALQCPACEFVSEEIGNEKTFRRDLLVGAHVGEYQFRQRIGTGGMSFVYEGYHEAINKRVAIKVLRPDFTDDPDSMRRLQEEARAVNAIRHRGIIDIFNVGTLPDGRPYVVMEFLEGQTLEEVLEREGKLPAMEVVTVLDEVTAALGAAHAAGVVHRDIKPSNIFLVTQSGGGRYVKLLDFGLAKQTRVERGDGRRMSQMVGTPEYMAPEQIDGAFSPRSDLYGLGVVAYRALTGRLPFIADSVVELVLAHQRQKPRPPSDYESQVPAALDEWVLQLLEKEPSHRPSSAETVRASLSRIHRELQQSDTYRFRLQAAAQTFPEEEENKEPTLPELDSHPELRDAVTLIRSVMERAEAARTQMDLAAQAVTPMDSPSARTPASLDMPWQTEEEDTAFEAPSARTEPTGLESTQDGHTEYEGGRTASRTESWEAPRAPVLPLWGWGVLAGSVVVLVVALWLLS